MIDSRSFRGLELAKAFKKLQHRARALLLFRKTAYAAAQNLCLRKTSLRGQSIQKISIIGGQIDLHRFPNSTRGI